MGFGPLDRSNIKLRQQRPMHKLIPILPLFFSCELPKKFFEITEGMFDVSVWSLQEELLCNRIEAGLDCGRILASITCAAVSACKYVKNGGNVSFRTCNPR